MWQGKKKSERGGIHDIVHHFRHSSPHTPNKFPLRLAIPLALAQASDAAQVTHNVLGLPKINLLQQVTHLELHVLDKAADVCDVAFVVLDRQVLLDLARHVAAQVNLAQGGALGSQ